MRDLGCSLNKEDYNSMIKWEELLDTMEKTFTVYISKEERMMDFFGIIQKMGEQMEPYFSRYMKMKKAAKLYDHDLDTLEARRASDCSAQLQVTHYIATLHCQKIK